MCLGPIWTQYFPPKNSAPITSRNLASQSGEIFIITGGSSGIGLELCKILYAARGKIYILTRTKSNAEASIKSIEESTSRNATQKSGELIFIYMDLEDLESVKNAAREFAQKEKRLDVLFSNVGVASVKGKTTKQGIEYHFGVNNVGHVLLEKPLRPVLSQTAKVMPKDSVRVVWSASILVELMAPKGGVRIESLDSLSKDFVASELSKREGKQTGVVSIAGNPGSYVTNVWRTTPGYLYYPFRLLLRSPIHGAYTYLWMAFSDEIKMEDAIAGRYGMCDGRWHLGQRLDELLALKVKEEVGTG
ncbi:NAD(P)-binding protein [Lojkania enalia]|uniref:NAD(P)-binding protein n=1 Tax=Lojkania enalia TaxID=147567 RepID=A0A9P4K691_9PLEO|nr:NAD(P)-binding protein [Didymosphaeria enalia]